jgi:hypothetical protein
MRESRGSGATAAWFVWGCLLLASIVASPGACPASLSAGTLDSLVAHDLQFARQQLARSVTEVADPSRFPRSTRSPRAYGETHDARLLDTAQRVADWFIGHLPADRVPYWDFDAPNIPNEPRDTSAAAIAASGLVELSALVPDAASRASYRTAAFGILASLSSPAYLAESSTSRGLLLHGVGNKPANSEVDVSLIYGDYYFLDALLRYQGIVSTAPSRSAGYSLMQNVPNPFNPWTRIGFEIPSRQRVALRLIDARGALVRTLVDRQLPAGSHALIWDGMRGDGRPAPSGVYLYELQAGNIKDVRKADLIR